MKKGTIILIAVVALLVIWGVSGYNKLLKFPTPSEAAVDGIDFLILIANSFTFSDYVHSA